MLRPGRFDLVIPIGPPDTAARQALWSAAIARLDQRGADIEALASVTQGYSPGDVELATQRAAATAFTRIRDGIEPGFVTAADLESAVTRTTPSVTPEINKLFAEEAVQFSRV